MRSDDAFTEIRSLSVEIGDDISILMTYGPAGLPTADGLTFENLVDDVLSSLVRLTPMVRADWKRTLLNLVGMEVQQARDAWLRDRDADRVHQLIHDADGHFRQFCAGVPPGLHGRE
ncbi:MAG: hypothetical protein U0228_27350 [Myxococcaceae bacterium]